MAEGTCRAAPEELRRRSLLKAEGVPAAEDDEDGKEGCRRGGLAVDTCGLKETFRWGFVGVGRGAVVLLLVEVGRRGADSEGPPLDAMVGWSGGWALSGVVLQCGRCRCLDFVWCWIVEVES